MSARTRLGRVRGRPDPGRGTRTRPRTTSNCGESPRCPAVITIDMGFCHCPTARCSFVVRPPRERPAHGRQARPRRRRAAPSAAPLFPRPGGMLMGAHNGGVDVEVPGDQVLRVGLGLQLGEDPMPGSVPLPAAEQVVRSAPRPVLLGQVPPGDPGADPEPYAVDQLPTRPYRRPSWLLALRQQRLQHRPLRVRQVSTCHEPRSSHVERSTSDTRPRRRCPCGRIPGRPGRTAPGRTTRRSRRPGSCRTTRRAAGWRRPRRTASARAGSRASGRGR